MLLSTHKLKANKFLVLFVLFFHFSQIHSQHIQRVIDGDTFLLESGERVRMIGINAPEISDFFGPEAKEYLQGLIENENVILESDKLSSNTDRYGRILRYVFLDGVDINKKMISDGYAFAYLKFKFEKADEYSESLVIARESQKGLWGSGTQSDSSLLKTKLVTEGDYLEGVTLKSVVIITLILVLFIFGLYFRFSK